LAVFLTNFRFPRAGVRRLNGAAPFGKASRLWQGRRSVNHEAAHGAPVAAPQQVQESDMKL
jgi:hypothetical protein